MSEIVCTLEAPFDAASPPKILVWEPSDDIEIGFGGAILRLGPDNTRLACSIVVFSALGARAAEAQRGATCSPERSCSAPLLKNFKTDHAVYR